MEVRCVLISMTVYYKISVFSELIPPPPNMSGESIYNDGFGYSEAYILIPTVCLIFLFLPSAVLWFVLYKRKR